MLRVTTSAQATPRIEGRISMTKRETTMTISLTRFRTPDLFVANDSLEFDRRRASQLSGTVPSLGAVTFVAVRSSPSEDLKDLALACGNEAISAVTNAEGKASRVWLFVADGPWRPANRIVRHQKLWKNHRDLVDSSGVLSISDEVAIEASGQIRFAGLLEVTRGSTLRAIESVRTNPACAIICSNRQDIDSKESIRSLFSSAFPKRHELEQTSLDWMSLAMNLCPQGDLLIRVSGLFDDREAAADVIALPEKTAGLIGPS
jgi:hypothetical protein